MVPDLIVLALDFFRAPLQYSHLADPERPLPTSFDNLVSDFGIALAPRNIGATARALGASPEEVERASRFFLRQVLLSPRSNHFRVLGVSPNASDEAIRRHYQLLIRIFHPDRSVGDTGRDAAYTARINEAYNVLKNPVARRNYERKLASTPANGGIKRSAREHVSSNAPIQLTRFRGGPDVWFPVRRRRLTVFLLLGCVAATLVAVLTISLSSRQPLLRANPDLADGSVAKPSYLREPPPGPIRQLGFQGQRALPDVAVSTRDTRPRQTAANAQAVPTFASPLAQREVTGLYREKGIGAEAQSQVAQRNFPESGASDGGYSKGAAIEQAQEALSQRQSVGQRNMSTGDAITRAAGFAYSRLENAPRSTVASMEVDIGPRGNARATSVGNGSGGSDSASTESLEAGPGRDASVPSGGSAPSEAVRVDSRDATDEQLLDQVSKLVGSEAPQKTTLAGVSKDNEKVASVSKLGGLQARVLSQNDLQTKGGRQEDGSKSDLSKQAAKASNHPTARPGDLIARLTRYYQAGDLNRFMSLFTANARINDGSGKGFIRSDYARLFATVPERRLSIGNLTWQSASSGRMIGRGAYRVRIKDKENAKWRQLSGAFLIELVPGKPGFKIDKMIHR